ncbi:MAG: Wadjet anti-phage system protein JetD domain-containing protein [Bryocella sp.]
MSIARQLLVKAFHRAQAAQLRGSSAHIRLPLSQAQCPDYFAMRNLAEAETFRAELGLAERKGAIELQLTPRQAVPRDVAAIVVADLSTLSTHLGLDLRVDQVAQARDLLAKYRDEFQVINDILDRWSTGKKVRESEPTEEVVQDLLDAVRVVQARRGKNEDVLMRRESIRLFQDSKRIEKLDRWLDILSASDLHASGLKSSEIFSALGLHKEPQPFLIAAIAVVHGQDGDSYLFRPYHGLPMASITGFRFEQSPSCVLTVENKQTFHELAVQAVGTAACVIYTGGMPSPAWHGVYAKVLQAIPGGVPVYHFGDLDVGGFRIAYAIAKTVSAQRRSLEPWLMDSAHLAQQGYALYPVAEGQVKAMQGLCERIGWNAIADSLSRCPGMLEQEVVAPSLPQTTSA